MSHPDTPPPLPPNQWRSPARLHPPQSSRPLQGFIQQARRVFLLGTLGRILSLLILIASIVIVLDVVQGVSPQIRIAAWWTLALLALAIIIRYAVLPTRRFDCDRATREVEEAHPELGQMLRTANDVADLPQLESQGISPEFAQTLMARAQDNLNSINLSQILPDKTALRWIAGGGAAFFVLFVMLVSWQDFRTGFARLLSPNSNITFSSIAVTTPNEGFTSTQLPHIQTLVSGRTTDEATVVIHEPDGSFTKVPMERSEGKGQFEAILTGRTSDFHYHIVSGDGQSDPAFMENREPAHLLSSSATLSPPSYLQQPDKDFPNADITGIEGSQVELRFEMSAPIEKASLHFKDGEVTPLQVENSLASLSFQLPLGERRYQLEATDRLGRKIEPVAFQMKGQVDKLPTVQIISPSKDASATAIAEIPVRFRVKDDHGIASFGLVLEAQGQSAIIMEEEVDSLSEVKLTEAATAALERFPLTIRDNVRLYAYATDAKPRGGARGVSKLKAIDIKQFKLRSTFVVPPPAEGPPPPPPEEMAALLDIIGDQRTLVSDTFVEREKFAATTPPQEIGNGFAKRQKAIQEGTETLRQKLAQLGLAQDDLALFSIATKQMGEAVILLTDSNLPLGFEREDAALSTLLELRKHLQEIILKSQKGPPMPASGSPPQPFADLAAEAERLAREEREIREKLESSSTAKSLDALQDQQDFALTDTGELLSNILDHPERTDLLISRMSEAEESVDTADQKILSSEPTEARPPLQEAAERLDEVAKHLRALDEGNKAETLAEMAEASKEAAEAAQPEEEEQEPEEEEPSEEGEEGDRQCGR